MPCNATSSFGGAVCQSWYVLSFTRRERAGCPSPGLAGALCLAFGLVVCRSQLALFSLGRKRVTCPSAGPAFLLPVQKKPKARRGKPSERVSPVTPIPTTSRRGKAPSALPLQAKAQPIFLILLVRQVLNLINAWVRLGKWLGLHSRFTLPGRNDRLRRLRPPQNKTAVPAGFSPQASASQALQKPWLSVAH